MILYKKIKMLTKSIFTRILKKNTFKIYKMIDNNLTISFDVFDTLVLRKVSCPSEVFYYIERVYLANTKYSKIDFPTLRIEAEKRAVAKYEKSQEISLEEIYNEMCFLSEDDRDYLKKLEIQAEIELAYTNDAFKELYEYALNHNKNVFFISDMYLPQEVIKQILVKCGYCEGNVIVSSKYRVTKKSGLLFKIVKEQYNLDDKTWLHIGDSIISDYYQPKKNKINAALISNQYNSRLFKSRLSKEDENYRKLQFFLYSFERQSVSLDELIGYGVFGPILYSFVRFLHENKEDDETFFFISREGKIIQQAYNKIYRQDNRYFHISRYTSSVASFHNAKNTNDILNKQVDIIHRNASNIEFACSLGVDLSEAYTCLENNGINPDDILTDKKLVIDSIFELLIKESRRMYNYLYRYFFSGNYRLISKIALVDVGWLGTTQMYLDSMKLVNENGNEIAIRGLYIGTKKANFDEKYRKLRREGYIYNDGKPKSDKYILDFTLPFFEFFFLNTEGSTIGYKDEEGIIVPIFDQYENDTEVAGLVKRMQEKALVFIDDFYKFSSDNLYCDLDANVSFENYRKIASNPSKNVMDIFKNVRVSDGVTFSLLAEKSALFYLAHPRVFCREFINNRCKVWFLKSILKIPFPYVTILSLLKKMDRLN